MTFLYTIETFRKTFTSRWPVYGTLKTLFPWAFVNQATHFSLAFSETYWIEGKDSYTLLHILDQLRRRAPIRYELVPVTVDSGYPGFRTDIIAEHLHAHGFTCRVEDTECYRIITEKRRPGSSFCAFCARLRRGVLYSVADELGCNKLALGHHLDDTIETLLLNQFYIGTLGAMSPKLLADNGRHTVIRPLVYVPEADITEFARQNAFPLVCCSCPAHARQDQKRQRMKKLISDLSIEIPHIRQSMIRALGNVQPRHLLDPHLKDFGPVEK